MKSVFLLKYRLRFLTAPIFSNKNMVYRKKLTIEKNSFSIDYVKLIEFNVVHT